MPIMDIEGSRTNWSRRQSSSSLKESEKFSAPYKPFFEYLILIREQY